MRNLIWIVIVVGLLATAAAAFAAPEKERPRCENCGMFTDVSATTNMATLKVGKDAKEHLFVCLGCIVEFNENEFDGKAELTALKVLDYNTFDTETPTYIDGKKAYYLYDTEELPGSMAPYIPAFATKDAAVKAQKTLGGELQNFKDMWAQLTSGDEEDGDEHGHDHASAAPGDAPAVYVCSCAGGCCDDIRSDKPGTCPNCGMTLVLASEKDS